jgi:hypothetical protein
MKRSVEAAKQELAQAEGALKQLFETLKADYDLDSVDAAVKLLEDLDREEASLNLEISERLEKLKADYEWGPL